MTEGSTDEVLEMKGKGLVVPGNIKLKSTDNGKRIVVGIKPLALKKTTGGSPLLKKLNKSPLKGYISFTVDKNKLY